ncbi:hypothetical protein KAH55_12020, partial [bacterium]|nr:hypothetical protein [bacterium]
IIPPRQQRLLAVLGEIDYQQHQFLARFAYAENGAYRNYVATFTSSLANFFTSGLSHLNAAIVTRGITEVTTAELVDAGIDILVLVPLAAWLTRGARVTGGAARSSMKSALHGNRVVKLSGATRGFWRVVPVRTLFSLKAVKWYALALVIYKPDLLNHAAALVAETISVPPIAVKTGFWMLLLVPVLNVLAGLFWGISRIIRSFLFLKKSQPA